MIDVPPFSTLQSVFFGEHHPDTGLMPFRVQDLRDASRALLDKASLPPPTPADQAHSTRSS